MIAAGWTTVTLTLVKYTHICKKKKKIIAGVGMPDVPGEEEHPGGRAGKRRNRKQRNRKGLRFVCVQPIGSAPLRFWLTFKNRWKVALLLPQPGPAVKTV